MENVAKKIRRPERVGLRWVRLPSFNKEEYSDTFDIQANQ